MSVPQSTREMLEPPVLVFSFSENNMYPESVGPTPQLLENVALGVLAYTTFGARESVPEAALTEIDQLLFVFTGARGLPKTSLTTPVTDVVT
jgi:hypothetical protein